MAKIGYTCMYLSIGLICLPYVALFIALLLIAIQETLRVFKEHTYVK